MNRLLALIRLRYLLGVRQFRGSARWTNRVVAALLIGLGAAVSLGMATGFGFLFFQARAEDDSQLLSTAWHVALWSSAFFGLFLPLLRGGTASGLEPESLLLYPVSRPKLFGFFLGSAFFGGSHFFYYPSLAAAAAVALLPPGPGSLTGAVILFLFVMVLVSWSHALSLAVRALMARRRLRELIILGAMILLILVCLLPAMVERYRASDGGAEKMAEMQGFMAPLARAAAVLPPSIAARGLCSAEGDGGSSGSAVLYLLLWSVAGLGAGYGLFLRERAGGSPGRKQPAPANNSASAMPARPIHRVGTLLRFLPPETRAVALKDLRYLLRSVLGRFSLLMAPVLVLMFVFIFSEVLRRPLPGVDPDRVLLFSTLLYIAFLSNNFLNNSFAWEGSGAQNYFFCPVSLRNVLLGKNIAVWAYNGLLFIISMITWSVVSPLPAPGTLATGLLVFATALLVLAMGGNLVSIAFPVARNPAAFMASPSQVGILTGILSLLASVLLCGLTLLLPALFGLTAWQPLFMALLLALLAVLYYQLLGAAARYWAGKAETFLQTVRKSA